MQELILVNEADEVLGYADKLAAHMGAGSLHRAFSVFIFNAAGEMLLQRRAEDKYHFPGKWTNACCGHPVRNETTCDAAERRLGEEMGLQVPLREVFSFIYRAEDAQTGLVEHELDHVLLGETDEQPRINTAEVAEWRWISSARLQQELGNDPHRYTPWFPLAIEKLFAQGLIEPI